MKFESLSLCPSLLKGLQVAGYEEATAIQQKAIPQLLKGRDLVGCAQTGTGKTAAFALPTLQNLMTPSDVVSGAQRRRQRSGQRVIRSLILAPTRELAGQIGDSFGTYGKFSGLRQTVIFGGVRQGPQVRALQAGVDILVATPGRLLDLIGQGFVKLDAVEILILDEADQMLDMGFIHDLRKIVAKVPNRRQTLMFSATMPKEIRDLASQWLKRPFEVHVAPVASTPELVEQSVYFVERNDKPAMLSQFLRSTDNTKTLVFSRTKRGADKIARFLERDGIQAVAIHGNKSQARRQAVMREFDTKHPPVLVATDLAARGLDFSQVSHVINYDLPDVPETYVHRIGRTARAGASGEAVSFCGSDERKNLRMIEKLTGYAVPVKKFQPVGPIKRSKYGTVRVPSNREGQKQTGSNSENPNPPFNRSQRVVVPTKSKSVVSSIGKKRRRLGKSARQRQKAALATGV